MGSWDNELTYTCPALCRAVIKLPFIVFLSGHCSDVREKIKHVRCFVKDVIRKKSLPMGGYPHIERREATHR
jgi:hypothetical protein